MVIALDPDIEARIKAKVHSGEFRSAEEVVQQALQCFLDIDGEDLADTKGAIAEALEQSKRGEAMPADTVFDDLRAKYGLRR